MDENDLSYDDAAVGDRISVEYDNPESDVRTSVSGEVVFLDVNANEVIMSTWFLGNDSYLYRLGSSRIARSAERYTVEAAKQQLSGFDRSNITDSLSHLTKWPNPDYDKDSVEVVNIERADESDDYNVMTDYELQAAALQEARAGQLSGAFDALLERQERIHTQFIRAQAYENDQLASDKLRIRSDRLRTGLKNALDGAND